MFSTMNILHPSYRPDFELHQPNTIALNEYMTTAPFFCDGSKLAL